MTAIPSFRSRIDVRRMRVLREVARAGSISDAADALHFSASAVSQQIRVLEREAGVALLDRLPCAIRLTEAADVLVGHADFILGRLEEAERDVRAIARLAGGRLRVATFRSAGEAFVVDALMYFGNRYPDVDLSLREGEPEGYLALLKGNELDLALCFEYDFLPAPVDDAIERVALFSEPMLVALPAAHELAGRDSLELKALAGEPWIGSTRQSAVHDFTRLACEAAGFTPRVLHETDDYHVVQGLVGSGLGIAFLPSIAAAHGLHSGVVVRPVAERQPRRRVFAAFRRSAGQLPAVAAMVDVLRELTADLPGPSAQDE